MDASTSTRESRPVGTGRAHADAAARAPRWRGLARGSWVLTLAIGAAASIITFGALWHHEVERVESSFRERAGARLDALEANVRLATEKVESMGAFFDAFDDAAHLDRSRFDRLAGKVWGEDNIVQALEWAPRVPAGARAAWERSARSEFAGHAGIREPGKDGFVAAAPRDEYFPVQYVYPLVGNVPVLGYDLDADPGRRVALRGSAASGSIAATPRVTLLTEPGGEFAFLLFRPVYRGGTVPGAAAQRQHLLAGFAIAVFRFGDIVGMEAGADPDAQAQAGPDGRETRLRLALFDAQAEPGARRLYPRQLPTEGDEPLAARPGLREERTLIVGERTWRVQAYAAPGAFLPDHRASLAALFTGLLLSGLIAANLRQSLRRQREVQQTVRLRTGELRQAHSALAREVSVLRSTEEALRVARDQAESANRAKSQFLATMSHEIRTPLNGVLGMAQLLQSGELDEQERREYAATIVHSGQALLGLLNDILDLSKVEAGRMEFASQPFRPSALLAEVARLFSDMASGKGLTLQARWDGAEDACLGDESRLRQMLVNLVNNAIKFTESGGVELRGRVRASDDGAIGLEYEVRDTGPGLTEVEVESLFQPFRQVTHGERGRPGGSGLGLSIVRHLAQAMGGDAWVRSVPGEGSTFSVRVRVLPAPPPALAAPDAGTGAPVAAGPHDPDDGLRILVAEDNPVNQRVIGAILRRFGIAHVVVADGQQAVQAIAAQADLSLVLMDCQMPVLDGYQAAERIRQWEREQGVPPRPIIALSAAAYAEDIEHCRRSGMDDFLPKPVNLATLSAAIERWRPQARRAAQGRRETRLPQEAEGWSG